MVDRQILDTVRNIWAASTREMRIELGMTQFDLAERTGMGIATIKRWESGKFWLHMPQFLRLCEALQIYPMLEGKDSAHPLAEQMRKDMDEVKAFTRLPENNN